MRYLLSSFCILFMACGAYPDKQGFKIEEPSVSSISNPYFSDSNKDYIYKANIDVYDNNFSGIFIVKKIGESNHRVAFTTEMGNKIFDFSFMNDDFKVNFIVEDLDKGILINILKRDFKALIQEQTTIIKSYSIKDTLIYETKIGNKKHYFFNTQQLDKIVRVRHNKEKVTFLFSEINDTIAKHIRILHSNIKLTINLKLI